MHTKCNVFLKIVIILPFLLFISFFGVSCSNLQPGVARDKQKDRQEIAIYSRITYYHNQEDGWGDKVAACPKTRNKSGIGVAAHPDFKFYTNIRIPALKGVLDGDDRFQVIDRGSAVTKRRAFTDKSQRISGKNYVFDVYVDRGRYKEITKTGPQYAWVIIEQ